MKTWIAGNGGEVTTRLEVEPRSLDTFRSTPDGIPYRWPIFRPGAVEDGAILVKVLASTGPGGDLLGVDYRAWLCSRDGRSLSRFDSVPEPLYRYRSRREDWHPATESSIGAHTFARESAIDELAFRSSMDPVEYRLAHLDAERDSGAVAVLRAVAERAAWAASGKTSQPIERDWLAGRGIALDKITGKSRAAARESFASPADASYGARSLERELVVDEWAAWIIDVRISQRTGEIVVDRVVAGSIRGKPGVATAKGLPCGEIEAAIKMVTGRNWAAQTAFDECGDSQVPVVYQQASHGDSQTALASLLEVSDTSKHRATRISASVAAAIVNALFDATGVRFRELPIQPRIPRSETDDQHAPLADDPATSGSRTSRSWWKRLGLFGGGTAMAGVAALIAGLTIGARPLPPSGAGEDSVRWSAETIDRGRQIALQGDCAVCHTAPGGAVNAGGLALDTPFGTIYTTNITPDKETGIGAWTYESFARAMRYGIAQDGQHLYPAFPYPSFAKMSEGDMLALYAYLMNEPAVKHRPPETRLPLPFGIRNLVSGWNWLFLDSRPYQIDSTQSAQWNRGKYLVDGAGHCGACHTPRNAMGAEKRGSTYLSGGVAEGWIAPSLLPGTAPQSWSEDELYAYLRTGFSERHGVAAGPMAPVVAGLSKLPESDVRAIAHYLASLSATSSGVSAAVARDDSDLRSQSKPLPLIGAENGQRIFETACAVCHAEAGGVGHFGVRPLMGLNTSVALDSPDNLMRVIMDGINTPATEQLGYMPGFRDALDDQQIADVAAFIRERYAPGKKPWSNLSEASEKIRRTSSSH
ncbi:c-type cytochrome [Burkholderia sp. BCC1977]|uniref:c-type cytochrome n=1 Tax=Burkholderia sp. BCC1977 TaxID=2817440 RepID=UPI002ABD5EC5|nr:c-type cytochrome [Burkholderia sp. BCC1977]